ncbi:MAG: hypothetical protein R3A51_00700 [Nannocystaceae bacterium]|nr:hypothetical protein [Myxococcales bacterium]
MNDRATLQLTVQTPTGLVVDERVTGVTAEDATGRFGVRPRAEPLVAALVAGILTARSIDGGERLVAVGPGILFTYDDRVEVAVRHAVVCDSLEHVQQCLENASQTQTAREKDLRLTFRDLMRKLAVTMVRGERDA